MGAVDLSILFLGTGGAVPTAKRGLPGILVRRGGERMLFDCGEGTQRQLISSVGLVDLTEIFLTHYHADHYLGLAGMLKSFDLRGRDTALTVFGPSGLRDLIGSLRRIFGRLDYPLDLVELDPGTALERDEYVLATYPTHHTAESIGYVLAERDRPGRFDLARARALGVPEGPDFGRLQRGEAVTVSGRSVEPSEVVGPARPGRKVVISGDTRPIEATRVAADGADVLIHEATFGDDEKDRAAETRHSTAEEAAEIAKAADVGLLALTHISTRYFGNELKRQARSIFANTVVPRDFDVVDIPLPERGAASLVKRGGGRHRGDGPRSPESDRAGC